MPSAWTRHVPNISDGCEMDVSCATSPSSQAESLPLGIGALTPPQRARLIRRGEGHGQAPGRLARTIGGSGSAGQIDGRLIDLQPVDRSAMEGEADECRDGEDEADCTKQNGPHRTPVARARMGGHVNRHLCPAATSRR